MVAATLSILAAPLTSVQGTPSRTDQPPVTFPPCSWPGPPLGLPIIWSECGPWNKIPEDGPPDSIFSRWGLVTTASGAHPHLANLWVDLTFPEIPGGSVYSDHVEWLRIWDKHLNPTVCQVDKRLVIGKTIHCRLRGIALNDDTMGFQLCYVHITPAGPKWIRRTLTTDGSPLPAGLPSEHCGWPQGN